MTALEALIIEFNEGNLPDDVIEKFKQLLPFLLEMPEPRKHQAVRRLIEVRRIIARNRAH